MTVVRLLSSGLDTQNQELFGHVALVCLEILEQEHSFKEAGYYVSSQQEKMNGVHEIFIWTNSFSSTKCPKPTYAHMEQSKNAQFSKMMQSNFEKERTTRCALENTLCDPI